MGQSGCYVTFQQHSHNRSLNDNTPATIALCGSASRSVSDVCRNDPIRVKLVPFSLNVTVTFSFSRACFFSRHIAKAQPTAWLSRSPYSHKFIGPVATNSTCIILQNEWSADTNFTTCYSTADDWTLRNDSLRACAIQIWPKNSLEQLVWRWAAAFKLQCVCNWHVF